LIKLAQKCHQGGFWRFLQLLLEIPWLKIELLSIFQVNTEMNNRSLFMDGEAEYPPNGFVAADVPSKLKGPNFIKKGTTFL
jgi:hypothetical protein